MRTLTKCHIKALKESIELTIIGGLVALVADLGWLLHDILTNGLSIYYILVGTGLLTGTIITASALFAHHDKSVHKITKKLMKEKVSIQRAKRRAYK